MSLEQLNKLNTVNSEVFADKYIEVLSTKDKGNVGLANLGKTCYANSILQSLLNDKTFRAFMLFNWNEKRLEKCKLLHKLKSLFEMYWTGNYSLIRPEEVIEAIPSPENTVNLNLRNSSSQFFLRLLYILDSEIFSAENQKIKSLKSVCEKIRYFESQLEKVNKVNPKSFETYAKFMKKMGVVKSADIDKIDVVKRTDMVRGAIAHWIKMKKEELNKTDFFAEKPTQKPGETLAKNEQKTTETPVKPKAKDKKNRKEKNKAKKKEKKKKERMDLLKALESFQSVSQVREEPGSLIDRIFRTVFEVVRKCKKCGNTMRVVKKTRAIELNLPEEKNPGLLKKSLGILYSAKNRNLTLKSVLENYFGENFPLSPKYEEGEEKEQKIYYCDKCKKNAEVFEQTRALELPETLVFIVNRIDKNGKKCDRKIDFPFGQLDMSPFVSTKLHGDKSCMYRLFSVVQHVGQVNAGHSISYTRHPLTGEWREFNDRFVKSVSAEKVSKKEAHVLFYERVTEKSVLEERVASVGKVLGLKVKAGDEAEEDVLISTQWLLRLALLGNSVSLSNSELVCKHGKLVVSAKNSTLTHIRLSKENFKKISQDFPLSEYWMDEYLVRKDGEKIEFKDSAKEVSAKDVASLENGVQICSECDQESFLARIATERSMVLNLEKNYVLQPNDMTYVISEKWMESWRAFVTERDEKMPGPICNDDLLDNEGKRIIDVKIEKDFRVVCKDVWDYMHGIYGGGPKMVNDFVEDKDLI